MSVKLSPERRARLFDLVKHHDMRVLMILDECPPCGLAIHLGRTLLIAALDDGNLPVAHKILDARPGQEYLEYSHASVTALDVALEHGHYDLLRKLAPLVSKKARTRGAASALALQDCEAVDILNKAGIDLDI
jgi:hypothetical protein